MKFITTDEAGKVQLIHNMPFHEKYGLGKTETELLEMGYLVDEIPEAEAIDGKIAVAYYTEEKGFYYEYEDAPNAYGIPDETYEAIQQEAIDEIVKEVAINE